MKNSKQILALMIISSLIFLSSCYDKSPVEPNNNNPNNIIVAKVTGDIDVEFLTKSINYLSYDNYSKLSASMVVSPFEIYALDISFPDSVQQYSFDLTKTDTLTNFKAYYGHIVKDYYFRNIKGSITFDCKNNDSITGSFTILAEDSLLKKSILIKDGKFKYIKN